MKVPCSPYEMTEGIYYFARMLGKIRLEGAGELRADLRENLGTAFDGMCVRFLGVAYDDLAGQVREGKSDSEALEWCFANGRRPSEEEIQIWNGFMRKVGWRDQVAEKLNQRKAESGFADRGDIQTMFDYLDADEGRPVRSW